MNWVRARRCESAGCVEASVVDGAVHLRSSLRPDGVAVLDAGEWAAFVTAVKAGDFDEVTL